MWKQALTSFLKPAMYREMRQLVSPENTLQEYIYIIEVLLAESGQNVDSTEVFIGILEAIFKTFMSRQFEFEFIPIDPYWLYKCSKCSNAFARHVKILPCGDLVCERCVLSERWVDLRCCECGGQIEDVTIDTQIFKEQLETPVRCIHHADHERVKYMVYRENEVKLADPELEELAEDFNENKVNIGPINAVRNVRLSIEAVSTDSDIYSHQITGFNRPIQMFEYFEEFEEGDLGCCGWCGPYHDLTSHLENECGHCLKTCSNFECSYQTNESFMNNHLLTCAYRQIQCPVCYGLVLRCQYSEHVPECLRLLRTYAENTDSLPSEYFIDVDLELKFKALSQRLDGLASLIVRWDNSCQREVVESAEDFDAPEAKRIFKGRFLSVLKSIYDTHIILFSLVLGFVELVILNVCEEVSPLRASPCALGLAVIEFANLCFFLLYVSHFVLSNRFRSAIAPFMFLAYYTGIFNCAILFTLLEFENQRNIAASATSPFVTFLDMMYFSGITGAGIGLGDIVPQSYVLRLITVAEIWYTQLICRIVFRGLSFFCKMHEFEQMKLTYTKEDLMNI